MKRGEDGARAYADEAHGARVTGRRQAGTASDKFGTP
jgi:hypothetical protein